MFLFVLLTTCCRWEHPCHRRSRSTRCPSFGHRWRCRPSCQTEPRPERHETTVRSNTRWQLIVYSLLSCFILEWIIERVPSGSLSACGPCLPCGRCCGDPGAGRTGRPGTFPASRWPEPGWSTWSLLRGSPSWRRSGGCSGRSGGAVEMPDNIVKVFRCLNVTV